MDSLSTAKMLLGIKDNEQDDLLSFLIDDMENLINSYCHTAEVQSYKVLCLKWRRKCTAEKGTDKQPHRKS